MKRIILFVIAISLLSACSSAPKVDLLGEWKLVSYGDSANPTPALPGVDTTISFMDGQVGGNVGCNSFGGGYQLKGNTITVGSIMSTEMYCEKTWAQESGVLAVLQGSLTVAMEGDLLILTSKAGQVIILARGDISY